MTPPKPPAPRTPGPPKPPVLDWSSPWHWLREPGKCRYCGRPTRLRDSKRHPAHKVCAEAAIAQQAIEQAESYHQERLNGT